METIISLVAMIAVGYGAFRGMKWLSKAGQMNARKELPLSPNDLKVLEESAARLMADLKATTDDCVARISRACEEAEARVNALELRQDSLQPVSVCPTQVVGSDAPTTSPVAVLPVIDTQQSPAELARQLGSTTGEIELMRGLRAIASD